MKKLLFLSMMFQYGLDGFSQVLNQVSMSSGTTLTAFCFQTDQQVIIRVSPEGKILEWGTAMEQGRYGYYPGKLVPYMGRVDYYGNEADSAFRGKVKSIGSAMITYYASNQPGTEAGKLKSIGNAQLDYYMNYDNESYKGKLKTAGGLSISYYASFDNESFRGKLKSIGSTSITWLSNFDDKLNKGKLKSIGPVNYTWYSQFDRKEFQGTLKTGTYSQLINGITYNIWQ